MTPGAGQASRVAPLASEQAAAHAFAVTHTNSDLFAACTNLLLIAKGAARVSFSPLGRDAHHRDALLYLPRWPLTPRSPGLAPVWESQNGHCTGLALGVHSWKRAGRLGPLMPAPPGAPCPALPCPALPAAELARVQWDRQGRHCGQRFGRPAHAAAALLAPTDGVVLAEPAEVRSSSRRPSPPPPPQLAAAAPRRSCSRVRKHPTGSPGGSASTHPARGRRQVRARLPAGHDDERRLRAGCPPSRGPRHGRVLAAAGARGAPAGVDQGELPPAARAARARGVGGASRSSQAGPAGRRPRCPRRPAWPCC
jgi:hypothetical protein